MRRRAISHDPRRLPRRLRYKSAYHIDADPDPTFHFDAIHADPDSQNPGGGSTVNMGNGW
jgi:hypothetical protein